MPKKAHLREACAAGSSEVSKSGRVIEYRPPKIAQLFVLIAAALHLATPLQSLLIYSNIPIAIALGLAGLIIMLWAWWQFQKVETAICPTATTTKLVASGIFRVSRNPMYLGMVAMLLAIAIGMGTAPFYVAAIAYFLVMNHFFCRYEEAKLAAAFGNAYESYAARVRRWI